MPIPLASRALLAGCCALAVAGAALAQPGNDTCGQNIPMFTIPPAGGVVSGNLAGATRDALGTSCPGSQTGADGYHYFIPAVSGLYTFDTCTGTTWDTVLTIHTAPCPVSSATELPGTCNDDCCAFQSRVSAPLVAGQQYILRIGGYQVSTVTGPYTMNVSFTPSPPNDECGPNNPTLTLDTPVIGNNSGASTSITLNPASLCGPYAGSGGIADVFHRFIPPFSGAFILGTCPSAIDSVLSVHSGCPATEQNLVACNDDGPSGLCPSNQFNSQLPVALNAGQTYFVRVARYRTNCPDGAPGVGAYTLVVRRDLSGVVGACCTTGSPCAVATSASCAGVYLGDLTTCSPDPCPQPTGACCIGGLCLLRPITGCFSPGAPIGAMWNGAPTCNISTSVNVPCCRADFNKIGGVNIQDIFDFLTAWFASSPFTHLAGDGTGAGGSPTVQDIFDFLAVWFAGGC